MECRHGPQQVLDHDRLNAQMMTSFCLGLSVNIYGMFTTFSAMLSISSCRYQP